MLEMPSDLDRPWEPRTFKTGDRVKVVIRSECPYFAPWTHFGFEDGQIGEVSGIDDDVASVEPGHVYWVQFDKEMTNIPKRFSSSGVIVGGYFAAIELEPLEDNRA